jgi:hypothetical protein
LNMGQVCWAGSCQTCGGSGGPCCPNNTCTSTRRNCDTTGPNAGLCEACGGTAGQECCTNSTPCRNGTMCTGTNDAGIPTCR